jgi:hypothetical protein
MAVSTMVCMAFNIRRKRINSQIPTDECHPTPDPAAVKLCNATGELLARYRAIFQAAWTHRAELAGPKRLGDDTYLFGWGDGQDQIIDDDATAGNTDATRFEADIDTDRLWFAKAGNHPNVSIIGTSDRLTLNNRYLGSQYRVEQFKTSDGKTLLDSQIQNLVNAMVGFSPAAAGQTRLTAAQTTALAPVIAANWQ